MIAVLSIRLRQLRTGSGLTQLQVADSVGVTRAMISAYETEMRVPSFDVLVKLSVLFGVTTDYLLMEKTRQCIDVSMLRPDQIALINNLIQMLKNGGIDQ